VPLPAANLDAMLKATGQPVVFRGVVTDPVVYGKLRREQLLESDGQGIGLAGKHVTLIIREGTQPADLKEDDALTVGGVAFLVRSLGVENPDGTRTLTLVGG
jgi:hypothetical protein